MMSVAKKSVHFDADGEKPQKVVNQPTDNDEPMLGEEELCIECHRRPMSGKQWQGENLDRDPEFTAWCRRHGYDRALRERLPYACCCQCIISTVWPERTQREGRRRHGFRCTGPCQVMNVTANMANVSLR